MHAESTRRKKGGDGDTRAIGVPQAEDTKRSKMGTGNVSAVDGFSEPGRDGVGEAVTAPVGFKSNIHHRNPPAGRTHAEQNNRPDYERNCNLVAARIGYGSMFSSGAELQSNEPHKVSNGKEAERAWTSGGIAPRSQASRGKVLFLK